MLLENGNMFNLQGSLEMHGSGSVNMVSISDQLGNAWEMEGLTIDDCG